MGVAVCYAVLCAGGGAGGGGGLGWRSTVLSCVLHTIPDLFGLLPPSVLLWRAAVGVGGCGGGGGEGGRASMFQDVVRTDVFCPISLCFVGWKKICLKLILRDTLTGRVDLLHLITTRLSPSHSISDVFCKEERPSHK